MKGLHLKILASLLVLFGLLFAIMALYEPLWWKWYEWDLKSSDESTRTAAAKTIAARGEKALPYIRQWLKSNKSNLVNGACKALELITGKNWTQALNEIENIVSHTEIEKAAPALELLIKKKFHFYEYHQINRRIIFNISVYLLDSNYENYDYDEMKNAYQQFMRSDMVNTCPHGFFADHNRFFSTTREVWILSRVLASLWLGQYGGKEATDALIRRLGKDALVSEAAAYSLGEIKSEKAVKPLINILDDEISRNWAIRSLGEIKNHRAFIPILGVLAKANPKDWELFSSSYYSLKNLSDYYPNIMEVIDNSDYWNFDKNEKAILWAKKYKHLLAWNKARRRYYLKPENKK